jgi:hypothetical protein
MGGVHSHRHIGEFNILKSDIGNIFTDKSIGIENYIITESRRPKTLAGYGRISFDRYNTDSGGPLLITCFYFRQSSTSTSHYTHYSFMNVGSQRDDKFFDDIPKDLYVYTPPKTIWEEIKI